MVATAWIKENNTPIPAATIKDNHGVKFPKLGSKVRLKTIPEKAPITMIPSRPTLTTPACSEYAHPILVKISGAAYTIIEETRILKIVTILISLLLLF